MGIRNRERRAAKAKARQRAGRRTDARQPYREGFSFGYRDDPPPPTEEQVAAVLVHGAARHAGQDGSAALGTARLLAELPPLPVGRAVASVTGLAVADAWRRGWLPVDLWQVSRRRLSEPAASFVVDAIAADAARHAEATLAESWRAQLRQLYAQLWWEPGSPHLAQWELRAGCGRIEALVVVIQVLALVQTLPELGRLLPPPGSAGSGATSRAPSGVDPKVLAKVRALLAKAESTDYAEEADAFFAKAQELMSRYALERAMLEQDPGTAARAGGRRIWLDNPYLHAKSMLVNAVAGANRCRAVCSLDLGFVTVLGDGTDLEIVEVLSTSLLVQASRAMVAAGRQVSRGGQSRTRSYRQSFLVSYATRIGERLAEASSAVAESIGDGRLLPVLAAREQAVDELFESLFPSLTTRRVSVSNAAGWGAGRAAADLAVLDAHRAVRG